MRSPRPNVDASTSRNTPGELNKPGEPGSPAAPLELSVVQELSNLYFELMLLRTKRFQSMLGEFGLVPAQLRALILMEPKTSMTMSELAHKAAIEPSNLTGIVTKLEDRALVKRSFAPTDRRVKIIKLTRAGLAMRAKLYARIREPTAWMLALSAEDQLQLLQILRKGFALEQEATGPAKS